MLKLERIKDYLLLEEGESQAGGSQTSHRLTAFFIIIRIHR
jgi:hypothetical protein